MDNDIHHILIMAVLGIVAVFGLSMFALSPSLNGAEVARSTRVPRGYVAQIEYRCIATEFDSLYGGSEILFKKLKCRNNQCSEVTEINAHEPNRPSWYSDPECKYCRYKCIELNLGR